MRLLGLVFRVKGLRFKALGVMVTRASNAEVSPPSSSCATHATSCTLARMRPHATSRTSVDFPLPRRRVRGAGFRVQGLELKVYGL